MELKKGFTIVELTVVIGIIGVLLTVGMNVFFQVVMSSNKATTEAELRQNTSLVMETVSREVRKAGCLTVPAPTTLNLYVSTCTGTPFSVFTVGNKILLGSTEISSPKVNFSGSTFTTADGKSVTVNLNAGMTGERYDFQGSITETQTITVRNYY